MKTITTDLAVIGGGPAGLAAAAEGHKQGLGVLILERDDSLGGILQQCIHDGFGIVKFKKRMTGGQYAQVFIDEVQEQGVSVLLETMVLSLSADKEIIAVSKEEGLIRISAKAVVLAMGCRERTRSQVMIAGTRPAGVYTAGTVQRYVNMEGYLPGKKAVILGSGDIGLIMARRMTLEGIEVAGVYELMASPGGLTRNIVQCLDDYDIPLHLATTVVEVHGKEHLEAVTVAKVDANRRPIPGTEDYISCDLLVLSVGLIPENELSEQAGIAMDAVTGGPVVNQEMMTSVPGIFAAGNAVTVFDLVDYVSLTGEIAARGAARFIKEGPLNGPRTVLQPGENAGFVVPQYVDGEPDSKIDVFLRAKEECDTAAVYFNDGQEEKLLRKHPVVKPPEMLCEKLVFIPGGESLTFSVRRREQ